MRSAFWVVLVTTAISPGLAMAQSPPAVTAPAPSPGVAAPAVLPGAPVAPLADADTQFVLVQTENNIAEFQAAQLALQHSSNQSVRDFAGKIITDHTYAQDTLASIAQMHHLQNRGRSDRTTSSDACAIGSTQRSCFRSRLRRQPRARAYCNDRGAKFSIGSRHGPAHQCMGAEHTTDSPAALGNCSATACQSTASGLTRLSSPHQPRRAARCRPRTAGSSLCPEGLTVACGTRLRA